MFIASRSSLRQEIYQRLQLPAKSRLQRAGVKQPLGCLARATMHAIEAGPMVKHAEALLVSEENVPGDFARVAQWQARKLVLVRGDNALAEVIDLQESENGCRNIAGLSSASRS